MEKKLNELADNVVPPEKRDGFVFHAHELFHGAGKIFTRDKFPKEVRWRILDQILTIAAELNLTVVWGSCYRPEMLARYKDIARANEQARGVAFYICACSLELFMSKTCADEVATIFIENNNQANKDHRKQHRFSRDPRNTQLLKDAGFGRFAMTHVVDDISFCQKTDSSPLQIADACAFTIKRFMMNKPDCERFYQLIKPQMVMWPKQDSSAA